LKTKVHGFKVKLYSPEGEEMGEWPVSFLIVKEDPKCTYPWVKLQSFDKLTHRLSQTVKNHFIALANP
jgi:hypothetical protein